MKPSRKLSLDQRVSESHTLFLKWARQKIRQAARAIKFPSPPFTHLYRAWKPPQAICEPISSNKTLFKKPVGMSNWPGNHSLLTSGEGKKKKSLFTNEERLLENFLSCPGLWCGGEESLPWGFVTTAGSRAGTRPGRRLTTRPWTLKPGNEQKEAQGGWPPRCLPVRKQGWILSHSSQVHKLYTDTQELSLLFKLWRNKK